MPAVCWCRWLESCEPVTRRGRHQPWMHRQGLATAHVRATWRSTSVSFMCDPWKSYICPGACLRARVGSAAGDWQIPRAKENKQYQAPGQREMPPQHPVHARTPTKNCFQARVRSLACVIKWQLFPAALVQLHGLGLLAEHLLCCYRQRHSN